MMFRVIYIVGLITLATLTNAFRELLADDTRETIGDYLNNEYTTDHTMSKRYSGSLLRLLAGSRPKTVPHMLAYPQKGVRKRPRVTHKNIPLLHQLTGVMGRARRGYESSMTKRDTGSEVRMQHQLRNLEDLLYYYDTMREKRAGGGQTVTRNGAYAPLLHSPGYLAMGENNRDKPLRYFSQQNIPILHQFRGRKRSRETACVDCGTDDGYLELQEMGSSTGNEDLLEDTEHLYYVNSVSKRDPYRGSILHLMSGKSFGIPNLVRASPSRKAVPVPSHSSGYQYNGDLGR